MSKGNLKQVVLHPRSTEKRTDGGRAAHLKEEDVSFQNRPLLAPCMCQECPVHYENETQEWFSASQQSLSFVICEP